MLCSISKVAPREPVVSRINGSLFERKLIEAYLIESGGRCPITNEPMSKDDLITVSSGGNSSSAAPATIPGLLASLQSEWDSVMLEQFSLRQQLSQSHQELSRCLFEHEAMCRVVAKLIRERDSLRKILRDKGMQGSEVAETEIETSDEALPQSIVEEIDVNMKRLKGDRLRREVPHNLASRDEIKATVEVDSVNSHSGGTGNNGVLCLDVLERDGTSFVFTGGSDARAMCYDVTSRTTRAAMVGHTRPIRCIKAFDDMLLTGSDDSTIRAWRASGAAYSSVRVMKPHQGSIVGFNVLPSRRHIVSAGSDGKVSFTDFEQGFTVAQTDGGHGDSAAGFSCIGLHPDGYMCVTGSVGKLLIWDLKQMSLRLTVGDGSEGSLASVSFNEDGYTMAAGYASGITRLYDFRKVDKPLKDLVPYDLSQKSNPCNRVAFSDDGTYLSVASNVVRLWDWKAGSEITTLSTHSGPVTDVRFGKDARWLASCSLDKTLRIFKAE